METSVKELTESINTLAEAMNYLGSLFTICLIVFAITALIYRKYIFDYSDAPKEPHNALDLLDKGEYSELEDKCRKVLSKTPKHQSTIYYLGLSLYGQEKYEQALEYFNLLIKIDPKWRESVSEYRREIETQLGSEDSSFH